MGELTLWERFQDLIAAIAWPVFLWSIRMTETQYLTAITAQAVNEAVASIAVHGESYRLGQKHGIEKAAEVAEHAKPFCPDFDNVANATACLSSNIAKDIRALLPKEGAKG